MSDRDTYHADQAALLSERRNPHVVSVAPKSTPKGLIYRALCVCGWKSGRLATQHKGEQAALAHRQTTLQAQPEPKRRQVTTDSADTPRTAV
jgi:hypothetical protein